MKWLHPFTRHPASVGESYPEHFVAAAGFSLRMIGGGLACLIHALLPFLFVRTGSLCVTQLHQKLTARHGGSAAGVSALNRAR